VNYNMRQKKCLEIKTVSHWLNAKILYLLDVIA
jgi:hypothetical protein